MASLLAFDPPREAPAAVAPVFSRAPRKGGTLIVMPLSLLHQWQEELQAACPHLTVYVFHGDKRVDTRLAQHDVVLTTYGTLAKDGEQGGALCISWRRVVLDEAHNIKNRATTVAKRCMQISELAQARWCLSGTPMQNAVEELFSMLEFMRAEPWSIPRVWRDLVTTKMLEDPAAATASVVRICSQTMLRRTKATVDPEGKPLLVLPPRKDEIHWLDLRADERAVYDALYVASKQEFDALVRAGKAAHSITHILQLILKLRMAACHVSMADGSAASEPSSKMIATRDLLARDCGGLVPSRRGQERGRTGRHRGGERQRQRWRGGRAGPRAPREPPRRRHGAQPRLRDAGLPAGHL